MRRIILASGLLLTAAALPAQITLPAAASFVTGVPFFSDVRVFNTSYSDNLDVTATYRCFLRCTGGGTPVFNFSLAPRGSDAVDDMVQNTFHNPDTAGGVEFDFSGNADQLVVTSRLYSTVPQPTVGMFIPGLPNSEAFSTSVLTSIRNGGTGQGFRTNVGVYNREDSATNVTFTISDAGAQVGNPVTINVPGHSGAQVNAIFNAAGQGGHQTQNGVIVVTADHEIFSYASIIDNNTTDPIFVRGSEDTRSTTAPAVTRTVRVGPAGMAFVDDLSGGTTSNIHVGDTVKWVWSGTMNHGVTAGNCTPGGGGGYLYGGEGDCTPSGEFTSGDHPAPYEFSRTFAAAGSFPYYCPVHGYAMRGRIVVSAPGAVRSQNKARPAS